MSPTEEEKAKARTKLKKLIPAWGKAAKEVEQTKAAFKDAADAFWNLKDQMVRIAPTAGIRRAEVQPDVHVRDEDWLLTREKGGIVRFEEERIEQVRKRLEDSEKK